jgi:hypothetical protein
VSRCNISTYTLTVSDLFQSFADVHVGPPGVPLLDFLAASDGLLQLFGASTDPTKN